MNILKRIWKRLAGSSKKKIELFGNLDNMSQSTGLYCPKCSSHLYSMSKGLQIYVCRKCGYQGNVGLPKKQEFLRNIKMW